MSLILDALNKSDQERPGGHEAPGLQTDHSAAVEKSSDWRKFAWPALACVFAVAAMFLWLRPNGAIESAPDAADVGAVQEQAEPREPVIQVEQKVPATPDAIAEEPAPLAIREPAAQAPAAPVASTSRPVDADVASLYAQAGSQSKQVAPVAPRNESLSEQQAMARADINPGPAATQLPATPSPGLDVDLLAQAAQSELKKLPQQAKPVVEHAVPLINDLNQSVKDEIPSVFFTMHHWSTIASEREVVLNGETRREGDTIKSGLKLVEILEDSIVLDYRGTEFRLRSLNSWVNL